MSDQATSALSNISPGDQLWYWLAFLGIICLLGIAVGSLIDIRRWWRNRPRLRDLMDDGDGQGGIPPIARKLAAAEAQTQAMSMRGMVAVPALQGITACPEFCDDLTSPGDPDACTCADPCSRAWCTRRREHNPVPVWWETGGRREGGFR